MLPLQDLECPYCGETISLAIDDSAGAQAYVEDCQVCCRPIEVIVAPGADGRLSAIARTGDDA
ncbi:CPXCG motif-containing cysteine-rich protein [Luteimonas vadosa]